MVFISAKIQFLFGMCNWGDLCEYRSGWICFLHLKDCLGCGKDSVYTMGVPFGSGFPLIRLQALGVLAGIRCNP
jgi:hypothetical protein